MGHYHQLYNSCSLNSSLYLSLILINAKRSNWYLYPCSNKCLAISAALKGKYFTPEWMWTQIYATFKFTMWPGLRTDDQMFKIISMANLLVRIEFNIKTQVRFYFGLHYTAEVLNSCGKEIKLCPHFLCFFWMFLRSLNTFVR
jgi:hypothetical protein